MKCDLEGVPQTGPRMLRHGAARLHEHCRRTRLPRAWVGLTDGICAYKACACQMKCLKICSPTFASRGSKVFCYMQSTLCSHRPGADSRVHLKKHPNPREQASCMHKMRNSPHATHASNAGHQDSALFLPWHISVSLTNRWTREHINTHNRSQAGSINSACRSSNLFAFRRLSSAISSSASQLYFWTRAQSIRNVRQSMPEPFVAEHSATML